MSFVLDKSHIHKIVQHRLVLVPRHYKNLFPKVLRQTPPQWVSIFNDQLLALVFVSKNDLKRISEYKNMNYLPFPGLYTTKTKTPAAFKMERSRFIVVENIKVKNSVAYSIGPDSTFIIIDHSQILTVPNIGKIEYIVPLAYFVSFGDDITPESVYDHLDDLIAYSVKNWRQSYGERRH